MIFEHKNIDEGSSLISDATISFGRVLSKEETLRFYVICRMKKVRKIMDYCIPETFETKPNVECYKVWKISIRPLSQFRKFKQRFYIYSIWVPVENDSI